MLRTLRRCRRTIASVSVYSTPWLRVGVYRCPPDSELWHETNDNIGERPHVVFPGVVVGLVRRGTRLVVTPNDVVFYRPFETYRRSLRDLRGDVSLFIAPSAELLDVPSAPVGQVDAPTFLLARRLARRLADHAGALPIEETAAELVERTIGAAARHSGRRPATRRSRAEIAESAKDLLVARLAQPLSLSGLAAELHVSPFHLTRVFRECTGRTLTAYLHDLRVCAAVELLDEDPGAPLARVAADLGYCTPSHFTDRFRATFGVPPSQLRNIMEAPPRASS
jgi:AraC-like DNA-binding protein